MKRILIVGCPGSGKTTLAKQLGELYHVPVVSLDALYFDPAKAYNINKQDWHQKITALTNKDEWIIEGLHVIDLAGHANRADQIIFLDYSRYLVAWRIVHRLIVQRRRVPMEMPEGWQEVNGSNFLEWWWKVVLNFKKTFKTDLDRLLKDSGNVVILRRRGQSVPEP